jgi:hypothetical protein
MSKVEKDKIEFETQTKVTIDSIIVTALDPVSINGGQRSFGFVITLDGIEYCFRTDTQGYLQLNNSGNFAKNFILN